MIELVHTAVAGRARLRVAPLRRAPEMASRIERALGQRTWVRECRASAVTGSVLVRYDPARSVREVSDAVREAAGLSPRNAPDRGAVAGGAGRLEAPGPAAWHRIDVAEALSRWAVDPRRGLCPEEVSARRARHGTNALPRPEPRSSLAILRDQITNVPVALLAGSAAVSLATGGLADALVILGVVAMNAGIGYATESQSEATLRSLVSGERPPAVVIREGRSERIAAEEIVPGDLLTLTPGTYVDADVRLVTADHLLVDESSLTGESVPAWKSEETLDEDDVPLADRRNMVYGGTVVTGGSGIGVVVETGETSELGRIERLVGRSRPPESPAQQQLASLGRALVAAGVGVCGVVFGVGVLRGIAVLEMVRTSISLAVAAVPEGLPTIATTTLALGIRRLRRHGVLARHLDAVETIGSIGTLCLDKTGTITRNEMAVVALHAGGHRAEISEATQRGAEPWKLPEEAVRLLRAAVLCSEIEPDDANGAARAFRGSPTERALAEAAERAGEDVVALRAAWPRVRLEHRSAQRNLMESEHAAAGGTRLVAVKGNPTEVLALCGSVLWHGETRHLGDERRREIVAENERLSGLALRVLGVASAEAPAGRPAPRTGLTWLGLVAMADPIRPGVAELVRVLHDASIETIMITGDQSGTAYAVGRALDLSAGRPLEALDAGAIETMQPEVLAALAQRVHVFSRVSPAHKLEIVRALQRSGKVVAMTGDGVNDGPALKIADVGIALGASGTEVARLVADLVVRDDRLETLVGAIAQGRTIHRNVRAATRYLLSTNASEILVVLGSLATGLGSPLSPMQLLWLNLVSDVFPGLGLAVEPPDDDVMTSPPQARDAPLLDHRDLRRVGFEAVTISAGVLAAYGAAVRRYGPGAAATTVAFSTLTFAQLLHALVCRSESETVLETSRRPNRALLAALAGSATLQVAALTLPPLRRLLGVAPIGLGGAAIAALGCTLPFVANELTKGRAAAREATLPEGGAP